MTDEHQRRRSGLLLGLGAYLLWGVMPLYFKALAAGPADRDRRPPDRLVAGLPGGAGHGLAALAGDSRRARRPAG